MVILLVPNLILPFPQDKVPSGIRWWWKTDVRETLVKHAETGSGIYAKNRRLRDRKLITRFAVGSGVFIVKMATMSGEATGCKSMVHARIHMHLYIYI